jgi:hypothetical protein
VAWRNYCRPRPISIYFIFPGKAKYKKDDCQHSQNMYEMAGIPHEKAYGPPNNEDYSDDI